MSRKGIMSNIYQWAVVQLSNQASLAWLVYLLSLKPSYIFLTKRLSYSLVKNKIKSKEKNQETVWYNVLVELLSSIIVATTN